MSEKKIGIRELERGLGPLVDAVGSSEFGWMQTPLIDALIDEFPGGKEGPIERFLEDHVRTARQEILHVRVLLRKILDAADEGKPLDPEIWYRLVSRTGNRLVRAQVRYEAALAGAYPFWRQGGEFRTSQKGPKRESHQDEFDEWARERGGIPKLRTRARQRFMQEAIEHFGKSKRQIERYMREHRGQGDILA